MVVTGGCYRLQLAVATMLFMLGSCLWSVACQVRIVNVWFMAVPGGVWTMLHPSHTVPDMQTHPQPVVNSLAKFDGKSGEKCVTPAGHS